MDPPNSDDFAHGIRRGWDQHEDDLGHLKDRGGRISRGDGGIDVWMEGGRRRDVFEVELGAHTHSLSYVVVSSVEVQSTTDDGWQKSAEKQNRTGKLRE